MNDELRTPSSVMYGHMKQFGGIANKDLASLLFSDDFCYRGPIRDRLEERTFVTRNVVHVMPGKYPESAFRSFPQSAERIAGLLLDKHPGAEGRREVVSYLIGPACDDMCTALAAVGQNDVLYRNIASRVEHMVLSGDADKTTLLVLLFIATGCLGDVSHAAEITLERSRQIANAGFRTTVAPEGSGLGDTGRAGQSLKLALCRVVDGSMVMPMRVLPNEYEGVEIGSLATSPGAINDVDVTVSRRHARLFQDAEGHWFIEGLGSTNGTTIIRGDTKQEVVVEPARPLREPNTNYPPVRIYPSDIICLAGTTQFMVMAVAE